MWDIIKFDEKKREEGRKGRKKRAQGKGEEVGEREVRRGEREKDERRGENRRSEGRKEKKEEWGKGEKGREEVRGEREDDKRERTEERGG